MTDTHNDAAISGVPWTPLAEHAHRLSGIPVRQLFAADPERFRHFSRECDGLLLDFSRQRLDKDALDALIELADACDLQAPGQRPVRRRHRQHHRKARRAAHAAARPGQRHAAR